MGGRGQRLCQQRPVVLVVQRRDDAGESQRLGERSLRITGVQGVLVEIVKERTQPHDHLAPVRAERAVPGGDAVVDVRLERGLEAGRLSEAGLGRRQGRVDCAVEDEAPDPSWEQLGVDRADVGAVGRAVVGQLRVTYDGSEDVEIAGHFYGRHVSGQRTGGDAALREATRTSCFNLVTSAGVSGSGS